MSDKHAVLNELSKLNVPHLVRAFEKASDSTAAKASKSWINEDEMKEIVKTASEKGAQGLSVGEWKAILEIAKYDKVGPQAKEYIKKLEKRWNDAVAESKAKGAGTSVSLKHAAKYKDDELGTAPYKGECAAGVQQVFSEAGKSLGLTKHWKPGDQVRGNKVPAGTAIASFKDGKYWKHAAVFIRETDEGLEVWDQWAGQKWHKRTLRFNDNDTSDGSNNGNLFFVILRK
jgi:hypothetical protein